MNKTPHPTASLIKQLHFSGRRVTFKVTDMEDRKHTVSGYHNEKWVESYDHSKLPYFICYDFNVYKNEFDLTKKIPLESYIIKTSSVKKHKFPNNLKIKLNAFDHTIKIFHYNKIDIPDSGYYRSSDIFDKFCYN